MQKCKGSSTWTLHGLWPEWGQNCAGDAFDVSQISSIKSQMEKYWLSCPEYSDSNEEFWSHEWSKHGTCTTMSQLDYFTEGLNLRSKYAGDIGATHTNRTRLLLVYRTTQPPPTAYRLPLTTRRSPPLCRYQGSCTSSDGSSCEFDCSASFTCTHQ